MFFINRNFDIRALRALLRCYSLARKNHYEVLKLRKNCSDREIKEAFIQMSKEFHPDKNKDAKAQDSFVRIVEAYNVLGKPGSRAEYDSMTEIETHSRAAYAASNLYRSHVPYNLRNHPQYNYYYETQAPRSKTMHESTTGSKKIPNYIIIAMCTGVALLGIILQVFVIRNLYVAQRQQAQEKTKRLAEELDRVRAAALTNGNEADNTFIINKKGKYCPYCGKYVIRVNSTCPFCKADWARRGERCQNCDAAIDSGWSFCEICGVETARSRRLKRAKMLSHLAKIKKAHSELSSPSPPPCPKSPDLFGGELNLEELDSIESTLSSINKSSERTPATDTTTLQTKILLDKIVAAANANVATASLGQALASEKK